MTDETLLLETTIWVVTDEPAQPATTDGARGWRIRPEVPLQKEIAISADKLQHEMGRFLKVVEQLFNQAEQQQPKIASKMHLDEVELSVEISAEGQVLLIGSGAKASGKGAIKLKFKRIEPT